MGQAHGSGEFFHECAVKEQFTTVQTLWEEDQLGVLIHRLKDMTLNFSLDKVKFAKLLQLPSTQEALVGKWFEDFSHDRASQVVDGLEFLSASVLISSKVTLFSKICLLFGLFDLDKTGVIRKDEFTIFLKAVTTGLHRMVSGLPPPASVLELGQQSAEFFSTLSTSVLTKQEMLLWVTEAHFSIHYLSVLSKLGTTLFAWGTNHRFQLGLNLEPKVQRLPSPLLPMEAIRIAKVASSESHTLFLSAEGKLWSCGSGFCGLLGQGNLMDSPQPQIVQPLAHTTIVDVAVGIRHSAAVSDKGQVFTWGAGDMYQLGHGSSDDKEVYEHAFDAKTGGTFAYVSKPTVVMALFGRKVVAKRTSCCNFSTTVLTDQGQLYSWGNNTDGQCGQGQRCPEHILVYVDAHMHRTAMQCIQVPKLVETPAIFKDLACGGYHTLAIDLENRLWTWGQGMWGKLGHGDQRSMYEPKLVECMRHNYTVALAAGESHSSCLCSLYRLTITGGNLSVPLSPFSLLGLPAGAVSRFAGKEGFTPPSTHLHLSAFVSAPLMQVGLPFRHESGLAVVNLNVHPAESIRESVVLIDRGLYEGEWLKLGQTDFDFKLCLSGSAGQIPPKTGLNGNLLLCTEGKWEAEDLSDSLCVFEVVMPADQPPPYSQEEMEAQILQFARSCLAGEGLACLCILPDGVEDFDVRVPPEAATDMETMPIGVLSYAHGKELKAHVMKLVSARVAEAADGIPDEVKDWRERREDFTGRPFYENTKTGKKRWSPPMVAPQEMGTIVLQREDGFHERLRGVVDLSPKGIVVCQQSWRPDVEFIHSSELVDYEKLEVPIVLVTYEAGEELKQVISSGASPYLSMEVQPYGGVFAWGNGTAGQLGLSGIENQDFLTPTLNTLTNEENCFAREPYYVAHLHEHQVVSIAAGFAHTVACTQPGEVFAWGSASGLGVQLEKPTSDVPMYVEQLEGLVKANQVFAGAHHSMVVADMPFKSIV
eukprot:TRINITY_DN8484_c0_g1_i2.p1 TRINITY_DN8484_c0_g1~~TRINITY_DN8484_c0_g1_i2.p1  ORF type:complete len:985 (-),score=268.41 TRINITY_DN8484_c0_g1_i2:149-3103(-)